MKGPNLKDTTPYTAVKGLNLGGPSKILLGLHQVGRRSLLCVFLDALASLGLLIAH